MAAATRIDLSEWETELESQAPWFESLGKTLPPQLEMQRQMLLALRASYAQLPSNKIALLPLSTSGAAANFAALTGLNLKWRSLTETQMVDAAYFTASRFPLAFYLGSENYVKTVTTTGDGKTAISRYLAGGGTLVVLATAVVP